MHLSGNTILNVDGYHADPPIPRNQAVDVPLDIEFLHWVCDRAFSQLSDYRASFLDVASHQHPSALTMFTLDMSRLTCHGLSFVRNIHCRSCLDHLVIMCTLFELDLSDSVAQVLDVVSWFTLKSLVLSGTNLNEWIEIGHLQPHPSHRVSRSKDHRVVSRNSPLPAFCLFIYYLRVRRWT